MFLSFKAAAQLISFSCKAMDRRGTIEKSALEFHVGGLIARLGVQVAYRVAHRWMLSTAA